jgi:hypothetical protein
MKGLSKEIICERVNKAFKTRIRMYEDLKRNDNTSCDFSYKFSERSGEPSLIVSQDGSTLYVYAYSKRFSTKDGITWGEPESLVFDVPQTQVAPGHNGVCVIGDTIFLIGRNYRSPYNLAMFTSPVTDGINFTYRGTPIANGHDFGDGHEIDNWGNSYIIKDADTYYLFIEGRDSRPDPDGSFWNTYLVTCSDPFVDNGDGTIGNWQNTANAPILDPHDEFSTQDDCSLGNPDIAKGMDNRPIRIDGKWYMYVLSTALSQSFVLRASSPDLIKWTMEGRVYENRIPPTVGQNPSSNSDQALIEFKGRTYFFYTTDINTELTPHMAYQIDDRPFREMLKKRP